MKAITLITALRRLVQCLLIGSLLAFAGTSPATERVTYYHNDALGSPVAATDASGTLLWREEYAPYGERLKKEAGSKDTVWYTGKQEESTFGLNYFGARWYDPKVGRFMGVDSAGFTEDNIHSYSKYAYANNNPYLYVDPDGNFAFLVPLAIFIAKEVAAEGFSQLTGLPNLSVKGLVKSGAKGVGKLLGRSKVRKDATKGSVGAAKVTPEGAAAARVGVSGVIKESKIAKDSITKPIGDGSFTRKIKIEPGRGPGQSRAEINIIKNSRGDTIRSFKDSFDRAGKFQGRKPLRGGPEGRPSGG